MFIVTPSPDRQSLRREDFVPESFEAMYAHYFPYVVHLVARFGIDFKNAEDVAQTILTKFFEKDALSDFDADYQAERENAKKAMFRTFLSGFVKAYVRHYIERQRLQAQREGISTDAVVLFGFSDGPMTWLELNDPGHEDDHAELEDAELIQSIRLRLAALPPKTAQEQCCLSDFFEAVLVQTLRGEKVDTGALSAQFGVTRTSINNWLRRLRTEIYAVIEERQCS